MRDHCSLLRPSPFHTTNFNQKNSATHFSYTQKRILKTQHHQKCPEAEIIIIFAMISKQMQKQILQVHSTAVQIHTLVCMYVCVEGVNLGQMFRAVTMNMTM